jgi:hypothetical protein
MFVMLLVATNARHVVESSTSMSMFRVASCSIVPSANAMVTAGTRSWDVWPWKHVSRMEYASACGIPLMAVGMAMLSAMYALI